MWWSIRPHRTPRSADSLWMTISFPGLHRRKTLKKDIMSVISPCHMIRVPIPRSSSGPRTRPVTFPGPRSIIISSKSVSERTPIEKYLKINNDLRKENNLTFQELAKKTAAVQLWEGPFLRLQNAATMARFADHRQYYYKGEKVDEQTHLGIDLASLANSPVPASNNGRVIFAGRVGIYGSTVLLDHGQGVVTVYAHLSRIDVVGDQEVKKGDIIGLTGQTGLAGGDHLHFSVMVHGVFVNPIEWWDSHWIRDNVSNKLAQLQK